MGSAETSSHAKGRLNERKLFSAGRVGIAEFCIFIRTQTYGLIFLHFMEECA